VCDVRDMHDVCDIVVRYMRDVFAGCDVCNACNLVVFMVSLCVVCVMFVMLVMSHNQQGSDILCRKCDLGILDQNSLFWILIYLRQHGDYMILHYQKHMN